MPSMLSRVSFSAVFFFHQCNLCLIANSKHRTIYRWLERKYQRYVQNNVSTTALAIRTSLRKSTSRTRTKITPQSADARKAKAAAVAAAAEENVIKSVRLLEPISDSSDIHNRVSDSAPTSAEGKPSDNSRDLEIELGAKPFITAPHAVRLPPLDHMPAHYEMLTDKNMLDAELDRPIDAGIRQKSGFQTKSDFVVEGIVSSGVVDSESHHE